MGFGSSSSQLRGKGLEYSILTKTAVKESIIKIENSRGKASRVCGKHNVLCFLECAEDLEPKTPLSSIADMWIFQVVTLFNIHYFISQASQLIVGKHFILCSSMISK